MKDVVAKETISATEVYRKQVPMSESEFEKAYLSEYSDADSSDAKRSFERRWEAKADSNGSDSGQGKRSRKKKGKKKKEKRRKVWI